MTDPSESLEAPIPPKSDLDNPAGHTPVQPAPWSFATQSIRIEGQPGWVAIALFGSQGRHVLMAPADFIDTFADQLKAEAEKSRNLPLLPPPSRLILPT